MRRHPALIGSMLLAMMICGGAGIARGQQDHPGDVTALERPWSPLAQPQSALRGDPRVTRTVPPPRSSAWERIQDPLDRSLGRIEGQTLWELGRIERARAERRGQVRPQREFERFQDERERRLRLEQRERRLEEMQERERRYELDRREYELYIRGGYSPVARQAAADEAALREARTERTRALLAAHAAYREALEAPGADPKALAEQLEQQRDQIQRRYDEIRTRILGD